MSPPTLLALLFVLQNPPQLEEGKPLQGEITAHAQEVTELKLGRVKGPDRALGTSVEWTPSSSGTYTVDLISWDFDSYLRVLNADGTLLAEDNDSYLNHHSRLVLELKKGMLYQVLACSLRGGGSFTLKAKKGGPRKVGRKRVWQLEVKDLQDQIAHLEAKHGEVSKQVASAVTDLARKYRAASEFEFAMEQYMRSLDIRIEVFGEDHVSTAATMLGIGGTYRRLGGFAEAEPYLRKALAIRVQELGADHMDTAVARTELGQVLKRLGEYKEAQQLYQAALQTCRMQLGPSHIKTAGAMYGLAQLYQALGNFAEARHLYEQSLAIRETSAQVPPKDLAFTLTALANLVQMQGESQYALELNRRALAIRMEVDGPEHMDTATAMESVANILRALGKYEQAIGLHEQALEVLKKRLPEDSPRIAVCLTGLGSLYQLRGSFEEAQELYEEAVRVRRMTMEGDRQGTASCITNLADFYEAMGFYDKALPLYQEALQIREKHFGPGHPKIAASLNNYSRLLRANGDSEQALAMSRKAVEMRRKTFGDAHPATASSLSNLAGIHSSLGQVVLARDLLEEALAIRQAVLGDKHPHVITNMNNLARVLQQLGEFERAYELRCLALRTALEFLDREMPALGEAERLRLLKGKSRPGGMLSCLPHLAEENWKPSFELYMQWKGKATRMQRAGIQVGQLSDSPQIRANKGRLQELSQELSRLILLPITRQDDDHQQRIADLRLERSKLERALNSDLHLEQILAAPTLAEVQAGIADDAVLVDLFIDQEVYAWVIRADGDPHFLTLGNADQLRAAMNELLERTAVRGGKPLDSGQKKAPLMLSKILWQPLEPLIGDAQTVFLSPDGFLCELPFGVIPSADGSYLLEKHRFCYLSDPSGLIRRDQSKQAVHGPMLAVGGINYFKRDSAPSAEEHEAMERSRIGDSWSTLPGTREELISLTDLHQHALDWPTPLTTIDGAAATEERIRAELPGNRYLHIATHGYFEPDHLPSLLLAAAEEGEDVDLDSQKSAVGLLPGLLSGLVFAGVNGAFDPDRADGYLSAEEIQYLDLSACDLVVLSACETALGSARSGEGLMSLRRAFEVAGAETVISSLWKVDDKATAQMMKDFYSNLWLKGMSRGEALHRAKLRLLRRNRLEKNGDAMPSTWGAFVLSGDWR